MKKKLFVLFFVSMFFVAGVSHSNGTNINITIEKQKIVFNNGNNSNKKRLEDAMFIFLFAAVATFAGLLVNNAAVH